MIAVLALLLATGSAKPALPAEPIAVIPFKNVSGDHAMDWLSVGVAETLITDLRKSGKVRVVERSEIDHAIAEVLLEPSTGTAADEARAARIGKLVGAKTIVVGSYQEAEKELRINARFVSVETGEIVDTAKATGLKTKVFELQDQIVDRLLGGTKPASRPVRKASEKALESYHLYAMALTVASDADRVGLLRQSLDLDPDFVYAKDDLSALEQRIAAYHEERSTLVDRAEEAAWKIIDDDSQKPALRVQAALRIFSLQLSERKLGRLEKTAKKLLARDDIPAEGGMDSMRAYSLHYLFMDYDMRNEWDLAMQAGDQYLQKYPLGSGAAQIDMRLRWMIEQRKKQEKARGELEKRYEELEALRVKAESSKGRADVVKVQVRNYALERCWRPSRLDMELWERSVLECRGFINTYRDDPDAAADVLMARSYLIEALGSGSHFPEAWKEATALQKDAPESAPVKRVESYMSAWPVDIR